MLATDTPAGIYLYRRRGGVNRIILASHFLSQYAFRIHLFRLRLGPGETIWLGLEFIPRDTRAV